tara:strand:- start:446 stop:883 length:438 start_codon:yes stop_codon:yes gene_type:complete
MNLKSKIIPFFLTLLLIVGALETADHLLPANAKGSPTGRIIVGDWHQVSRLTLKNQRIYGYSSEVSQTDETPFVTASGYNLNAGGSVIANNCYPFGTIVSINGRRYRVDDRMNSRYGCDTWDIWFPTRSEAINWGKRYLDIIILK